MQNVTEKLTKFYQSAGKPFVELAELNSKYLIKLTEQAKQLHEVAEAKKPQDLFATGLNSLTGAFALAADHWRKASEIVMNGCTEAGKIYADTIQDVVCQASSGLGNYTGYGSVKGSGGKGSGESGRQQQ